MQSNVQERRENEAATCDVCGSGLTPDDRMNFEGSTISSLIRSAHDHLADMQDKMHTTECILAKLMEMQEVPA